MDCGESLFASLVSSVSVIIIPDSQHTSMDYCDHFQHDSVFLLFLLLAGDVQLEIASHWERTCHLSSSWFLGVCGCEASPWRSNYSSLKRHILCSYFLHRSSSFASLLANWMSYYLSFWSSTMTFGIPMNIQAVYRDEIARILNYLHSIKIGAGPCFWSAIFNIYLTILMKLKTLEWDFHYDKPFLINLLSSRILF